MAESTEVVPVESNEKENEARQAFLKAIRAEGRTDDEITHMLYLSDKYGLDPLAREIYLLPFKNLSGKTEGLPYVSYAGLIKCAHKSGDFDGIEEELVFSESGNIIGARARVWTKGSNHPTIAMGMLSEYTKGRALWLSMPGAMLMKCVKARAIRDAFGLEGLYIEDEFKALPTNESQEKPLKQEIKEKKKKIEEPKEDLF
jgi:phage recombination protein Bet